MRVIVDAFGGDNAPLAVLNGCSMAVKESDIEIVLTGDENKIKSVAQSNKIDISAMKIINAPDIFDVHTDPGEIMRSMKNSSLAIGLSSLAEGKGDAFVSAGSTGAIVMGASLIVKRIKGVKRAALTPIMPTVNKPYLLIDAGANIDCRPEMLCQFGVMASVYVNRVLGVENPRVGLLNVGTEDTKGGELQLAAFEKLKSAPINFIGNVEARDVPYGVCDVLVTDGFSGNIVLKLTEGLAMSIFKSIKTVFTKNLRTKLAAALLLPSFKELMKKVDYTETGGAPLIGTAMPIIKAHGSSNARAMMNAILAADKYAKEKIIAEITNKLGDVATQD